MSYFLKFLSNLTDPSLIKDITQTDESLTGSQIAERTDLHPRALNLYNYLYEKEAQSEEQLILQYKKYLSLNFEGLFFRKSSFFKVNVTIDKFKKLLTLLTESNKLLLIKNFLQFYPSDLVTKNLNAVLIHCLTINNNDENAKEFLSFLITHYKLERNSVFTNLIQLCELKNFTITKKFLTEFMGLKLENINAVDLILNYALNSDFPVEQKEELVKALKEKAPDITLEEWRLVLKNYEKLKVFKLEGKDFYNFFLTSCNINIYDLKSPTGVFLLAESLTSWDIFKTLPAVLTPVQAFTYAVYIKKNNPSLTKKSIITILKEYLTLENKKYSAQSLLSLIPQFPILWWGCDKNSKKYTSIKFWAKLELIPEVIPLLQESKATNLAQGLFGEKGTSYTKIVTELLNDGAVKGEINWAELAYLSLVNKLLHNRDDFQSLLNTLTRTKVSSATYHAMVSFFNNSILPEISSQRMELFNQLSKETKFNLLSDEVDYTYLNDCFEMMKRLNSLKLDFTPPQTVDSWKSYHDFLLEENQKIKVKGIKLNQDHLIPHFHNKEFIGMKVHVPLFSEDFVWAGTSLGICVGTAGYDRKVASKESSIVFLLDGKKVKYVIEFTHQRVIQAKGKSNSNMNPMHQTLLKAFMKENWWNNPLRTFKNDSNGYDYDDFERGEDIDEDDYRGGMDEDNEDYE